MNYPQLFFHHIIQEPGVKFQREEFPVLSSWMERIIIFIHSLCKLHNKNRDYNLEMYGFRPLKCIWFTRERMLPDEAVREYLRDTETHSRFMATVATGSPNYNMLSES